MDGIRIKKELDDGNITIEYNDLIDQTPLKIPKFEDKVPNIQPKVKAPKVEPTTSSSKVIQPADDQEAVKTISIPQTNANSSDLNYKKTVFEKPLVKAIEVNKIKVGSSQSQLGKSSLKAVPNTSHNEMPISSKSTKPIHTFPYNGAAFLHTHVHSNPLLRTLLKDIVTLNNDKSDIDEDAINQEIATLRSRNNLPSLNTEVPNNLELADSDFSEGSGDESCNYYDSKGSENNGKDSGYDNESQYSGSLEEDNKSEIQDCLGDETEKPLVIVEPEYIDLDNYFVNKNKRNTTYVKGSLAYIRANSKYVQPSDESKQTNKLTCPDCNKTLKTQRTYKFHIKRCIDRFRKKSPQEKSKHNNSGRTSTNSEENYEDMGKNDLITCIGKCKFIGTKTDMLTHIKERHVKRPESSGQNKTVAKQSCKNYGLKFRNNSSLEKHFTKFHKNVNLCLFCDFQTNNLTEYNLHISSKHNKSATRKSVELDGIQIIEIDDD